MPASTSSQPARRATYQPLPPSSPHPPSNPPSSATSTTPAASPNTTSKSTLAHQAAHQQQQRDEGGSEAQGSGWTEDEMAAWPVEGEEDEHPPWTGWVLDDERRHPPVARARSAGASAAYRTVRTQVLLAKQRLADVDGAWCLDWMRRTEVEEEVRMWMMMQDLAARFAGYAADDADRERRSRDARYVADGGDPATQPASSRG
ncbi:hypothetical protein JCM8097_008496 [Rhodosporidiobolus ruineniae]